MDVQLETYLWILPDCRDRSGYQIVVNDGGKPGGDVVAVTSSCGVLLNVGHKNKVYKREHNSSSSKYTLEGLRHVDDVVENLIELKFLNTD